jgi:hypothetical protein
MRRQPALTFSGALKILGKHDSSLVAKLDKALGGAILAAGLASGLTPLAMLGALWGWVDQKNEAITLLRSLTSNLTNYFTKTKGLERRDLIAAAHTTIAAAAFFEVLEETLGKKRFKELSITEEERRTLLTDKDAESYFESLYHAEIPAPSPSRGFHENLPHVDQWIMNMGVRTDDFIVDVHGGEPIGRIALGTLTERAVARYESHYLRLAERVPEFLVWAILGEHAATREHVTTLDEGVRAALDAHSVALSRVEALLSLIATPDSGLRQQRESLRNANRGVLDRPIVHSDAEGYDTDITFPTIQQAFLAPRYRITSTHRGVRPADEDWWAAQPAALDLELMLTAYLTSPDATRLPMLILGHPGAGKSMLAKVLAARLPPSDYTVVRVPLRGVHAGAPIVAQIQQALDAATNSRVNWHALTEQSADTVRLVLLDGLDELLQAATVDRSGYLQDVMEFQRIEGEQGQPVAVVVTSRTVVADRVEIPEGVTIVKLDEFNDDQLAAWLDIWRRANATAIARGTIRELTVNEAHHQLDLARQPLLLLMLAVYAADPKSPKLDSGLSTSALYERIFDNFARREVQKHATPPLRGDELKRAVDDQLFRLSVAALAMFNRGLQHLRERDLRADLAALCQRDDLADDEGKRILGEFFFVHSPEALVLTKERSYEFLHATFGEYLVARHVMSELAELADAAYGGRRTRTPDDEMLFALLSHQAWIDRSSIIKFAQEIFGAMSGAEQGNIRRAVRELIQSYRHRKRTTALDAYRPVPVDFVRQLAAYSVNLVSLALTFDEPAELGQVGAFGDTPQEALARWRSTLSLWRSGLDSGSWQAMVFALDQKVSRDRVMVDGLDEFSFARLRGDFQHANRIRHGIGIVDRKTIGFVGGEWAEFMLSWINPAILYGLTPGDLLMLPPSETVLDDDISRVGSALSLLLRIRAAEMPVGVVSGVVSHLVNDLRFTVNVRTIFAVACFHPLVLLRTPEWRDRELYADWHSELRLILDHGPSRLSTELWDEWRELGVTLLKDAPPSREYADENTVTKVIEMLAKFGESEESRGKSAF